MSVDRRPADRPSPASVPLIVLGRNWKRGGARLSVESRMNVLAAAELLTSGRVDRIIFTGGRTAGATRPSEAEAMLDYLRRLVPVEQIAASAVLLESDAIDTADNAVRVRAVLDRLETAEAALLTVDVHLPAARQLFRTHGVAIGESFSAEAVLSRRSVHYQRFLARRGGMPQARLQRLLEGGRRVLLRIDRRGTLLRPFTRLLRQSMKR